VNNDTTVLYRASKHDCQACSLRSRCCPNTPARKVPRSIYEGARDMAREIASSWEGRTSRRLRKKIEMGRGLNDGAEILIGWGTASREGAFDLEPKVPGLAGIVENDNKVIHRVALATLLDGNAGNDAGLASGALVPPEMRKIVGDDGVFVSEARAAPVSSVEAGFCSSISVKASRPRIDLWIGYYARAIYAALAFI
jgi:hypothetical protein